MLDTKKMLYGLDDVCIIPTMQSWIDSRSECSVTFENSDKLPIFVAPMSCLVNYQNYPEITRLRMYTQKGNGTPVCARINAILPRSEKLEANWMYTNKRMNKIINANKKQTHKNPLA